MPTDARRENGPWGPAIEYWLKERRLSQAELLRGINEARRDAANESSPKKGKAKKMGPNTISRIVRGFHTQTRLLALIAQHLEVPIEDVLVAPTRRNSNEDQEQLMQSMAELQQKLENARRLVEAGRRMQADTATLEIAKRVQRLSAKLRRSVINVLTDYERGSKKKRRRGGGGRGPTKPPPTTT